MATIFRDSDGILFIQFKYGNTVANGARYATFLNNLWQNIREKTRGKLTKAMCLLHHNAPAEIAICASGFEQINHPPGSLDMFSSDNYLFDNLRAPLL